ncbi:Electron transfer flavoprotein small subunit [Sphingomonas paucimobilis]|nr:Electron transfer flavoprotein small subunit [Sphingomonas paucimobilis]
MKIVVPVKRVLDYNVKPRVKADGTGVDLGEREDVDEPVRRDRGGRGDPAEGKGGGDRGRRRLDRRAQGGGHAAHRARHGRGPGILITADQPVEPLGVAKLLAKVVEEEQPGLVILGKQAIDGDNNQTGQMLAGLLGWAQGTFASKVEIDGETANVTREVDGGLETVALTLPAIVTTDLRLNEPRYASLPNIMKAKSKPMATKTTADYGVDVAPRLTITHVAEPGKRQAGVKVGSVDELVEKLKALGVAK